ncbi:MAG TPA: DUF177 domain-containing protein [Gemmatimonadales bacterium]|nr:DUF177 domain-containing protein [Gemmatimonadales bacterium]
MLLVDLRDLQRGPVETVGEVEPTDEVLQGLELGLTGPLKIRGRLQAAGEGDVYWRGAFTGETRGACRRCLTEVTLPISAQVDVLFSADPDAADDPSVYPLAARATHVDLRPVLREELVLAVPTYLLCREDCAGLCPRCGADLNQGPHECAVAETRS